jgi:hypothetical protein
MAKLCAYSSQLTVQHLPCPRLMDGLVYIALSSGACPPVIFLHFRCGATCLPHWECQTQEARYQSWYVTTSSSPELHSPPAYVHPANTVPARLTCPDVPGHGIGPAAAPTSDNDVESRKLEGNKEEFEADHTVDYVKSSDVSDEDALAQIIGVAILEFGVVLHRHVERIGWPTFS